MSELSENPELMLEILAKLVMRHDGYVRVTKNDEPTGPFNLLSKIDHELGIAELRIANEEQPRKTGGDAQ